MKVTRSPDRNAGFMLAEVVVGMAIFGVLVVAGLALLVQTSSVAGQNVRRTTAAGLLTRRIEAARATNALDIPEGRSVTTAAVGGTTYTLTQDASYVADSQSTSMCADSSGNLLYKLVTVTVTWPDMQAVSPVRGDTLRAVGIGSDGSGASKGALVVTVHDADGNLVPGAQVVVGDQTRTTGPDGCAVFVGLSPGPVAGTASGPPGSPVENQSGTIEGAQIQPGQVTRVSVDMSPPAPPAPPAASGDSGGGTAPGDSGGGTAGDSSGGGEPAPGDTAGSIPGDTSGTGTSGDPFGGSDWSQPPSDSSGAPSDGSGSAPPPPPDTSGSDGSSSPGSGTTDGSSSSGSSTPPPPPPPPPKQAS